MSSATEHYETLLAPVYLWMAGGLDHALALGSSDIADVLGRGNVAIDLGAGFGMHAIPLARAGFRVSAIDFSALLVGQLRSFAVNLDVHAVVGDLIEFPQLLRGQKADVIICMGDTLTHLPSEIDVDQLPRKAGRALDHEGRQLQEAALVARSRPSIIPVRGPHCVGHARPTGDGEARS